MEEVAASMKTPPALPAHFNLYVPGDGVPRTDDLSRHTSTQIRAMLDEAGEGPAEAQSEAHSSAESGGADAAKGDTVRSTFATCNSLI